MRVVVTGGTGSIGTAGERGAPAHPASSAPTRRLVDRDTTCPDLETGSYLGRRS